MNKILLSLVTLLCVATVSAQSKFESSVKNAAQTVASQKWSAGLRVGSTVQAVAECFYSDKAYVEGRFGMTALIGSLNAPVAADFGLLKKPSTPVAVDLTVLHNWNCLTMDWTPSAGKWFFDAGVGLSVGGGAHTAYVGVAGCAKLGIKFDSAPVRLSVDWTPIVGPGFVYVGGRTDDDFYPLNLANFGVTATYCF